MVSIPACHAGDRGSIPRRGVLFVQIGLQHFLSIDFYRKHTYRLILIDILISVRLNSYVVKSTDVKKLCKFIVNQLIC